jgi:hypothetical protein
MGSGQIDYQLPSLPGDSINYNVNDSILDTSGSNSVNKMGEIFDDSIDTSDLEDNSDVSTPFSSAQHIVEEMEDQHAMDQARDIVEDQSDEVAEASDDGEITKDKTKDTERVGSTTDILETSEENILDDTLYNDFLDVLESNADLDALFDKFTQQNEELKRQFLTRVLEDPSQNAEKLLELILPSVSDKIILKALLKTRFALVKGKKLVKLIGRLAPSASQTREGDLALCTALLNLEQDQISELDQKTMGFIRRNETLGDRYFQGLQRSGIPPGSPQYKAEFEKIKKLSARITTICYAYYLKETNKMVLEMATSGEPITSELIGKRIKGLSSKERKRIVDAMLSAGLITETQKVAALVAHGQSKEAMQDIETILENALKLKKDLEKQLKR